MSLYGIIKYGTGYLYGGGKICPSFLSDFYLDSYSETEPDLLIRTKMDRSYQKVRRRFTKAVKLFGGKIKLTPSQKATLEDFYRDNCAEPFLMMSPTTGIRIRVMFMKKPNYELSKYGYYYFASLELAEMP